MKRFTLVGVLTAFVVSASPVLGQGIGAHVGMTFATAAGDDVSGVDYKSDLSFGAFINFGLAPGLAIQPELNYMTKGADVSDVDVSGSVNFKTIQIPVLLKLSLPTPGVRPYVFAGPAATFDAGCTIEAEQGGVSLSADCDDPAVDFLEVKGVSWELVAGAGLGFGLGIGEASIDVRYDLGLTSIDASDLEQDIKSRAFTIMLGYSIGLGM